MTSEVLQFYEILQLGALFLSRIKDISAVTNVYSSTWPSPSSEVFDW